MTKSLCIQTTSQSYQKPYDLTQFAMVLWFVSMMWGKQNALGKEYNLRLVLFSAVVSKQQDTCYWNDTAHLNTQKR